jgi:5'-nucleotidase
MKNRPYILICNDDGVHAPGIRHLWNSLKDVADVVVVAPDREQSAVGLSITLRQPLHIQNLVWDNNKNIYAINGTPADCVKMALKVVLDRKPDLIVSGINRGSNAGRNVLYSGTVAATIEGTMQNIPSIAFSCFDYHEYPNYELAEQYVPSIVQHVLENPLSPGVLLNVNFPPKCKEIQGIKLSHHGLEYWAENPDQRLHPAEGRNYYWLGAELKRFEEDEGSDVCWLRKGFITAVPVQVNQLTDYNYLHARKEQFEKIFSEVPSQA